MDKKTIEDIANLKKDVAALQSDNKDFKEERAEWSRFCVKLVLKTGITLLGIITLGTFWGYLSPGAKKVVEELIK